MHKAHALVGIVSTNMNHECNFELDLDGQVTCTNCGAMGDDMPNPQPELNEAGYSTGKWSEDDDVHPTITPIFGPNR